MVEPKLKWLNQNGLVQPKYSKNAIVLEADNRFVIGTRLETEKPPETLQI